MSLPTGRALAAHRAAGPRRSSRAEISIDRSQIPHHAPIPDMRQAVGVVLVLPGDLGQSRAAVAVWSSDL